MRWLILMVVVVGCTHEPIGERKAEVVAPQPAVVPIRPTPAPVRRVQELWEETSFGLGGVGFANVPTDGYVRTLEIARRPDAIEVFERFVVHENRVARLYAYWALRTLAPERARAHEVRLRADETQVETWSGCSILRIATHQAVTFMIDRHPPMPPP